jgi:hypothetical protein
LPTEKVIVLSFELGELETNATVRNKVCQSEGFAVPVNDNTPVVELYDAVTPDGKLPA